MYDTLSGPEEEETLHESEVDQAEISEGVLTLSRAERSISQGSSSGTGNSSALTTALGTHDSRVF